ncbi:MAG: acetyl-coenzyme A synthetase N-terminal domain-containing protein [Desulfobacterales bacterium]
MTNQYDIVYRESIDDPEKFWGRVAEDCHRYKKWDKVLDDSNKPLFRWFTGGELNTCYNALDYHVDERGRGDKIAIIYDSPVTGTIQKFTYAETRDIVAAFKRRTCGPGG